MRRLTAAYSRVLTVSPRQVVLALTAARNGHPSIVGRRIVPRTQLTGSAIDICWSSFVVVAAVAATLVLVSDELLKVFVRARFPACDTQHLVGCKGLALVGPLRLVRSDNASSVLGYAQGWGLWVLLAAVGLLLVPLYARRLRSVGPVAALAAGLQVGGAMGNLLDRVCLGGATDMLTVGPGLVWNLADVALAVGTVLATVLLLHGPGVRDARAAHTIHPRRPAHSKLVADDALSVCRPVDNNAARR